MVAGMAREGAGALPAPWNAERWERRGANRFCHYLLRLLGVRLRASTKSPQPP